MPELEITFVERATGARQQGPRPRDPLGGVSSDSRTLEAGQLFVALKGERYDGHQFVAQALAKGAAAALVARGFSLPSGPPACLLEVPDTLKALGDLAAAWRREFSTRVAAITGSNGKTTSKEMLAAILGQRHRVLKNRGNLNNLIGLPLTLLTLDEGHSAAVLEMGMNQPGEIARLTQIAAPEAGLITNVGPAHLGPLGSLEAVAAAKVELFQGLSVSATALVNLDDPRLAPWARRLDCRVLTFGLNAAAEVRARSVTAQGEGQSFELALPMGEPVTVRLPVAGLHNVRNAVAAAAAAWALGQDPQSMMAGLISFRPMPGRLTPIKTRGGMWLLDDTYNANPASLAAGLQTLDSLAGDRPRALILGDMLELGPSAPQLHFNAGRQAVESGCSLVLALGEQAEQVVAGARDAGLGGSAAQGFGELDPLLAEAGRLLNPEHVLLVKGSRSMHMERAVKALTGRKEAH